MELDIWNIIYGTQYMEHNIYIYTQCMCMCIYIYIYTYIFYMGTTRRTSKMPDFGGWKILGNPWKTESCRYKMGTTMSGWWLSPTPLKNISQLG